MMNNYPYNFTTQREVRRAFWLAHPHCQRRPGDQNSQPTDTRVAFVDYVDMMARERLISEALAQRVAL